MTSQIPWILSMMSLCSLSAAIIEIPPEGKCTVPRPPTITMQPSDVTYAIPRVPIVLRCAASAQPDVKSIGGYSWEKNGSRLDIVKSTSGDVADGSIVMSQSDGSITFNENLSERELKQYEGRYQCFASNDLGTAMTSAITLKAAASPYQRPENKEINVRTGASITVPCNYSSSNDRVITWTFQPATVTYNERIAESADGSLVFANVLGSDNGLIFYSHYRFKTQTGKIYKNLIVYVYVIPNMNTVTNIINLIFPAVPLPDRPPTITSPVLTTEPRIVLRDDTLRMKCIATGKPVPSVRWEKLNGNSVVSWPNGRFRTEDFGRTAVISNASYGDSADYRCTATNALGEATRISKVLVHARPFFSVPENAPHDVIKTPGSNVTIRCQAEGIPAPEVEWRVNGVPIAETSPMDNRVIHPTKIRISNLKVSDSAVYQCIASNMHNSIIKQAYVNVLISMPLPVSSEDVEYVQVLGKTVEMKCNVFGSPSPAISWQKDGNKITENERFLIRKSKYLRISEVTFDDAGAYTCVATNEYGNATLSTSLTVFRRTKIQPAAQYRYFVRRGESVTMSCVAFHPKVCWPIRPYKYDIPHLINPEETNVKSARLTLMTVWYKDHGSYKVMVNTSLDHAAVHLTLVVQEYKIEFEKDNYRPGKWFPLVDSIPGDRTSFDVTLAAGLRYKFRLWALNGIGWSEAPSAETGSAPTANPSGVSGKGNTPTNMIITWDPVSPVGRNGPEFGYQITYCTAPDCTDKEVLYVDGEVESYEVVNLPTYTQYIINIMSYNNIGNASVPQDVLGYSGEDAPGPPSTMRLRTTTDTGAHIAWGRPQEENGDVIGYVIKFVCLNDSTEIGPISVEGTSYVTSQLRPNHMYDVTVAAQTLKGVGETANIVMSTMAGEGCTWPPLPTHFRCFSDNELSMFDPDRLQLASPAASAGVVGEVWFIVLMCIIVLLLIIIVIVCLLRRRKGGKYSVAEKEGQLVDQESQQIKSDEYNDETDDAKKPLKSPPPVNGKSTPPDISSAVPLRTRGDSVAGDSIDAFGDDDAREFNEDGSFIGQYGAHESGESSAAATPADDNPVI
uniref:protein-tyrosine-phosphatase n=1 Tax=Ciona savignyi TaxID=51511 RepID=H2YDX9_CIOSA